MKEKIIAAIKTKFPKVNLSKARLNAIAAKIEAKVIDDETKIDAELTTYDEYNPLAEMAKQDDTIRNYKAKEGAQPPAPGAEPPANDPPADDTPAWAKALQAQIASFQADKVQGTMRQKAEAKLKDVPASYWKGRPIPETDEALDAFVTEVTADYTAFKQEMKDQGMAIISAPPAGGDQKTNEAGVSPEMTAYYANKAKANPVAAKQN